VQTRRSPESNGSYGIPGTIHEPSTASLLANTNTTRRTSVAIPGSSVGGYVSPEYSKPRTPYEDKVVPALRNRNRSDAGHMQSSLMGSTTDPAGGTINEETESMYGGTSTATNDDATAELNQAEMIEANQMMIVFDKQLVSIKKNFCLGSAVLFLGGRNQSSVVWERLFTHCMNNTERTRYPY
jgi:hypothetical protein